MLQRHLNNGHSTSRPTRPAPVADEADPRRADLAADLQETFGAYLGTQTIRAALDRNLVSTSSTAEIAESTRRDLAEILASS